MTIFLYGNVTSSLTHLAMLGLAAILEDAGVADVYCGWRDGPEAVAAVESPLDPQEVGTAIRDHAKQRSEKNSWVQAVIEHEGRESGLFSPRLKAASSSASWQALQTARRTWLDGARAPLTALDHAFIGALGEPAYWLVTDKDSQPDQGASRWEMKTRNRGEEFVGNRLSLLATVLAGRDPQAIIDGLTGVATKDELGRDSANSRTPTGLTSPRPTDTALAWCALWGISATTLIPQAHSMSQTAGSSPRTKVHPNVMSLPAFAKPVTVTMWKLVAGSREFDDAAFSPTPDPASKEWLVSRGVASIVRFPTRIGGSSSAPERMLLNGDIEALGRT